MNRKTEELRKTVKEDYRLLLVADARLSLPEDYPKIRGFYREIANAAVTWTVETYGETIRAAYLSCKDVYERAAFRTRRLELDVFATFENEKFISVLCTARGNGELSMSRKFSALWNLEEQTVLPQSQIWNLCGAKKLKNQVPFRPDGIYLEQNRLICFRNERKRSPFCEKSFKIGEIV